nr:hypothetical protein SHINE37_44499 [Rhizobiaceae bacterium]
MNELGGGAPGLAHVIVAFKQKNRPQKQAGFEPGLFSYLFYVAASRPAKSPRDNLLILRPRACVNWRLLVLCGPSGYCSETWASVFGRSDTKSRRPDHPARCSDGTV